MALAILLGAKPLLSAETIFVDNARIQTGTIPTLFLDRTVGTGQIWSIVNSGAFNVKDVTEGTSPLVIIPGAPSNSLHIEASGNVGMGTGAALVPLHLVRELETRLRLDTLGNGLILPQAFDLTANVDGFTIFDVDATTTPLTIEASSPNKLLYLSALGSGHVGIGTSQPDRINGVLNTGARHLTLNADVGLARAIVQGETGAESYLVHKDGPLDAKIARARVFAGRYLISALKDDLTNGSEVFALCVNLATGNVGVKCVSPTKPFQVGGDGPGNDGNGAHVTIGGVWTNASSRTYKDDIQPLTSEQAHEAVRALQPVGYRYKNEPDEKYVGFIAEDVPELVATNDRKSLAPMDVVAVLTKVVQDQDRQLETERERNDRLEATVDRQQQLVDALSKRLAELEAKTSGK